MTRQRKGKYFALKKSMLVIRSLKDYKKITKPLCLTIGNFDGVHLGHKEIIKQVKKAAKEKNLLSAILTFEPHPIQIIKPDIKSDFRINSLSDKLRIFEEQGIDLVIVLRFDKDLAKIPADEFLKDILVNKFNLGHLVVGYDFTFGSNRLGNFDFLQKHSQELNFTLEKISKLQDSDVTHSSSLIRELISGGDIADAKKYLGYNFSVSGLVVNGQKMGSQIGFPTCNILPKKNIIKPRFGVYKTITHIKDLALPSITNFGIRPTIERAGQPIFENHIFDFDSDIYGQKIKIEFIDFIREEMKFSSKEELTAQIKQDVASLRQ